jgi:hypothetical protein
MRKNLNNINAVITSKNHTAAYNKQKSSDDATAWTGKGGNINQSPLSVPTPFAP